MRIAGIGQFRVDGLTEVRPLVLLGAEPGVTGVGEHRVQQHQPLDDAAERRRPAMPVIRLADRGIKRFVMDVEDLPAMQRARDDRGSVAAADQRGQELLRPLTVSDAREGAVLAFQEHAREDEDMDEKLGLTERKSEVRERRDTDGLTLFRARAGPSASSQAFGDARIKRSGAMAAPRP